MSDLPYVQRNNEVQIVGQDSVGNQVNYVSADVNGNMAVKDYADGSATGGTAATVSALVGGIYNTTLPTLTNAQQASIQLDASGRVIVRNSEFPATIDTNYGTVGASTLRTASEIGNATGAANFGAGATGAQTLRVAANLSDGAGTALSSTLVNSLQALDVQQAAPALDRTGTGTITALNGTVIANTQGCSMVTFYVSGTFSFTYLWEGTADGTNWVSVLAYNVTYGYVQGSNNYTNVMYSVGCGSFQQVRMRASTYTSGTATINWDAGQGTNADHMISNDTNPISQSITVLDTGTTSYIGANGQVIYGGTPTAGSVNSYPLTSIETIAVECTGTWTGTLQIETSMDSGGSWFARTVHQATTNITSPTFTANFFATANVAGCTNFRIRAVAPMTGTATPVIVQSKNAAVLNITSPATGQYNSTPLILTNGEQSSLQLDSSGRLEIASGDRTTSGTIAALAGTFVIPTVQSSTVTVSITGTWVGTIVFEAQDGDGNWFADIWNAQIGGQGQSSTTVNDFLLAGVGGYFQVRLRASAWTSGTANITATTSLATNFLPNTDISNNLQVVGNIAAGSAIAGNPVQIGGSDGTNVREVSLNLKGTQGVYGVATQNLKDAGRNVTNYFMITQVVSTATDTLVSLTGYKSGAAVGATTTPAVVTAGKTYRINMIVMTYIAVTTAGTIHFTLRANTGGVVAIGSPEVSEYAIGAGAATAGVAETVCIPIPDGLEFAAGTGIGVSMQGFGATGTAAAVGYGMIALKGYEY